MVDVVCYYSSPYPSIKRDPLKRALMSDVGRRRQAWQSGLNHRRWNLRKINQLGLYIRCLFRNHKLTSPVFPRLTKLKRER